MCDLALGGLGAWKAGGGAHQEGKKAMLQGRNPRHFSFRREVKPEEYFRQFGNLEPWTTPGAPPARLQKALCNFLPTLPGKSTTASPLVIWGPLVRRTNGHLFDDA